MTEALISILILFSSADGPLTQRSARELTGYLRQIYNTDVVCMADADPQTVNASHVIVIGSATDVLAEPADLATLERHVLIRQANGRTEVMLRGGSELATRAAVFRFLEHCGVLLGPLQDFLPDPTDQPDWQPMTICERASRPIFGPHYWINFPMDPSGFSREQWMQLVQGWSHMGATTMGYHFFQGFPWYDTDMRGFKEQTGYFFYSHRHPLPDKPELRYAIHNNKTFVPPDVAPFAEDAPRVHQWAQQTLRQSMALAHELGMKNSVTFEPYGYGLPQAYMDKLQQWNGGKPVDVTDRLHPLMQEYVISAIRTILTTYPDIDILKLVSGEADKFPGPDEKRREKIMELLNGDLTDIHGRPVELPSGQALAILTDALVSCKLAHLAVIEAKRQGIIPDHLQIAIGCYPGSNMEVHPGLFALIGKVVPDPAIKIHLLPAHGMGGAADAMDLVKPGTFTGRQLEISGWTELDGIMYVPQSCLADIEHMNKTLAALPADALYAIQWRVAATTLDNAYFCRSQWDNALTPEMFWNQLIPLFGRQGTQTMQQAMLNLKSENYVNFGFCYYRCWPQISPLEREDKTDPYSNLTKCQRRLDSFKQIAQMCSQAAEQATSRDGRRLADYFANKAECAAIHCRFWQLTGEASEAAYKVYNETKDENAVKQALIPFGRKLRQTTEDYLKHYQEVMFDRTDEGVLASYYMTATRFAWRFEHPEQDDMTGKFYDGPVREKKQSETRDPDQIRIMTPDLFDQPQNK